MFKSHLFTATRAGTLNGGDLKIMFYRARFYDPYTGRFLRKDSLEKKVTNFLLKFKVCEALKINFKVKVLLTAG